MQLVRFVRQERPCWGVERSDGIHSLAATDVSALSLTEVGSTGYDGHLRAAADRSPTDPIDPDSVNRLAPVPSPGKLVCVGLNYHDHAEEQDEEVPDKPLLFAKAPSSVTHPNAPIVHPPDVDQLDYEVELAFVVGRTTRNVPAEEAMEHIAGFTVVNDVSARDAQFEDGQFFRGKSYDTFAPMGPALVTPDAVDADDLAVELRVNGTVKQSSTTAEFIFGVDELVEYISHRMTLQPGDVVSTGTPGGVGIFQDPPDLLEPGDTVEAEIEGLGVLVNEVVASSDAA